ncbi:MAG: hypothetical protein WBW74_11815, partial [Xanthobacteraceae bacterium]
MRRALRPAPDRPLGAGAICEPPRAALQIRPHSGHCCKVQPALSLPTRTPMSIDRDLTARELLAFYQEAG